MKIFVISLLLTLAPLETVVATGDHRNFTPLFVALGVGAAGLIGVAIAFVVSRRRTRSRKPRK